ncbi:Regulator of MON1-CCZ1 complex [Babesia duncani]|uniref:Regulator of MON1-CCZ1 complex n=1 Tax=Babesia duncani TaxID=323732 RepID=A0AAD9UMS3_9APIC|nr:Regulator of MON1-CCZ1 complex [Babesia duncani]
MLDKKLRDVVLNSIRFDKPLCESLLFSNDGRFVLYWYNDPLTIGIYDLINNDSDDVLFDPLQYDDLIVLRVFWVASHNSPNADIVVVSTRRIDIYNFSFSSMTLRLLNKKSINCIDAWHDIEGKYLVLLQNNQTLVPYTISNHDIKNLFEIEINASGEHKMSHSDISIATIYHVTYCIYKDISNGTISLRAINNPNCHDVVLEVNSQGWLEICVVNNLLLALTGSGETYIFDIGLKEDSLIARVPQSKPPLSSISNDIQDEDLLMLYLTRYYTDAVVADFYQRRMGCIHQLLHVISTCVSNDIRTADLLSLFCTIITPYANIIRKINENEKKNSKKTGIPFETINAYIGNKSIITERSIASAILYPYIIKDWGLKSGVNIFDCSVCLFCHHYNFDIKILLDMMDEMDVSLVSVGDFLVNSSIISNGSKSSINTDFKQFQSNMDDCIPPLYNSNSRGSYHIITVMMIYLKGLRLNNLYPSHLLQILLFDTCILYNDISLLKFILRSNLIKDSHLICYRLLCMFAITEDMVLGQLCLDMALRVGLLDVCVAIHTFKKEYSQIVQLLKQQRNGSYPLSRVLRCVANDIQYQTQHPYLWPCIISFIHCWVEEHQLEPRTQVAPNLRDCEMWLPQSASS